MSRKHYSNLHLKNRKRRRLGLDQGTPPVLVRRKNRMRRQQHLGLRRERRKPKRDYLFLLDYLKPLMMLLLVVMAAGAVIWLLWFGVQQLDFSLPSWSKESSPSETKMPTGVTPAQPDTTSLVLAGLISETEVLTEIITIIIIISLS